MNHASPLEIHDHVYGFSRSAHVEGCAECRAFAEGIAVEASALRGALRETPVAPPEALLRPRRQARPRFSAGSLVAAGVLLAILAGILFHAPQSGSGGDLGNTRGPSGDADIDRLIGELRGPSAARRQAAVLALKAYGEAALEPIVKAKVDPKLFGGYRLKALDAEVDRRLRSKKIDLDRENMPLEDILSEIGQKGGVKIVIDSSALPQIDPKKPVTIKVRDLLVLNVLKLLGSQFGSDFRCEDGAVVILGLRDGTVSVPVPARAPVRIGKKKAVAVQLLADFGSDSDDRREAARRALKVLGFAAEEALWEALDSPNLETQGLAGDLLRALYTPEESGRSLSPPQTRSIRKAVFDQRSTVDFQGSRIEEVCEFLRQSSKVSFHLSGVDLLAVSPVTFKGSDLPLYTVLVLLLEPRDLVCSFTPEAVLITSKDSAPGIEPRGPRNFWTTPEEARRFGEALGDLGTEAPAARERATATLSALGARALPLLRRASEILEGAARDRCRALRQRIASTEDPEGLDEPRAEDLATRSPSQQSLLDHSADLEVKGLTLGEILKHYPVGVELRSQPDRRFSFEAGGVRLETLLNALTAPFGLDFFLQGDRIVIDRAAAVRAALKP